MCPVQLFLTNEVSYLHAISQSLDFKYGVDASNFQNYPTPGRLVFPAVFRQNEPIECSNRYQDALGHFLSCLKAAGKNQERLQPPLVIGGLELMLRTNNLAKLSLWQVRRQWFCNSSICQYQFSNHYFSNELKQQAVGGIRATRLSRSHSIF